MFFRFQVILRTIIAALFAVLLLPVPDAAAQTTNRELRIGTRDAPPFAMKDANGDWNGIAIDLLEHLSNDLHFDYRLVETSLSGMVDNVANGSLDASIAAMTITPTREEVVDFSHPYYRTGLGVAVADTQRGGFATLLVALTSPTFLGTLGVLVTLLFIVGYVAWRVERRANPEQFEPEMKKGLLSGFWWAAVTMTTVGYGDKAPVTNAGRIVAMVWMFSALILTAVFTAQLAASLTAASMVNPVSAVTDLPRVRVGALAGASSGGPLRELHVRPTEFDTVEEGLQALGEGYIDAFVHDRPVLAWNVQNFHTLRMTDLQFADQDYGIILPENSPMREQANRAILSFINTQDWARIQSNYLGQ
ncbi:transporter substrate-binding domain-containing protein [Chachezhania sediminis]|uniref:transporter substrate-binding domain-containing protein n=1 Tax=Chachezhania sediminis TaxID=2599291 RepID=UPI00131DD350|nr:transporter substrate-binding domain-containing protein [Chachezhania sediminis]